MFPTNAYTFFQRMVWMLGGLNFTPLRMSGEKGDHNISTVVSLCLFFLLFIQLRPMGLNVLGYQSHLLQRCHPACGQEGSSHLSPVHAFLILYRDGSSAFLQPSSPEWSTVGNHVHLLSGEVVSSIQSEFVFWRP